MSETLLYGVPIRNSIPNLSSTQNRILIELVHSYHHRYSQVDNRLANTTWGRQRLI